MDLTLILILVGLGVVLLIVGFILLYIFVISRIRIKNQIKDLEKKYSYLDALLTGQDAQYIHRLEMISRSNLLYVEKHEYFQKRFNEIYENDDKYVLSIFGQLKALIANRQYKQVKKTFSQAKVAMKDFEEKVTNLDNDLFNLIKPEEDTRQAILKLKDNYRRLKQSFYSNSGDLDLVAGSLTKVFDKLDLSFAQFENLIESADYDGANNTIPNIQKVINAVEYALNELPKLCILTISVVPQKIDEITVKFENVEKQGLPLYNLTFKTKHQLWNDELEQIKRKLIGLQVSGIENDLNNIMTEISDLSKALDKEIQDRDYFLENCEKTYNKSIELENSFLKICSILPEIKRVYKIAEQQETEIEKLQLFNERLGNAKRSLDDFVHSNTKQPYSILKAKLDELTDSYDVCYKAIRDFKAYLDSIKNSCEEAYSLVFVYFYRCKQIETILREMNIDVLNERYLSQIDSIYSIINSIDILIKAKPIIVEDINEKVEELKNTANVIFEEIEEKFRQMKLAESAIVYANRDRNHQREVAEELTKLEADFANGEFDKVYREATAIYRSNHVEENDDAQ